MVPTLICLLQISFFKNLPHLLLSTYLLMNYQLALFTLGIRNPSVASFGLQNVYLSMSFISTPFISCSNAITPLSIWPKCTKLIISSLYKKENMELQQPISLILVVPFSLFLTCTSSRKCLKSSKPIFLFSAPAVKVFIYCITVSDSK